MVRITTADRRVFQALDNSVRNYSGGPAVLAVDCKELMKDKVARTGYAHIAATFRNAADFGPKTVRLFLEESSAWGAMTPEQIQMDAFMQVSEFLRLLVPAQAGPPKMTYHL